MTKRKALLIGDNERAQFHPLKGFDKEFVNILIDFEITQTTDYEQLREENLLQFYLIICFVDNFRRKLNDEQTVGLLSFVSHGGGLLMLHNGISIQERHELTHLAGGKFTGHPEQKVLSYTPVTLNHVIMNGISSFHVKEEPYQFILDNMVESTLLFEYDYEGEKCPAGWAHTYGMGRVVYLSPGHNLATMLDPTFRKLVNQSALWATKIT